MKALAEEQRREISDAPRLMVVEDDVIVARDVADTVEELGYQVVATCRTGEDAVEVARERRPDLALMDIRLAGAMDGIDAAGLLLDELELPVIYLTAYADESTRERVRRTGPFGYVVKPFGDRDLQTAIEIALLRHDLERRLRNSERRFRQMAETIREVFYLRDGGDDSPGLLYVSPAYEEIWGRSVEDLYEDPAAWSEAILDEERESFKAKVRAELEQAVEVEYRIRRPDGEVRWILDRSFPVGPAGADGAGRVAGVARDVTERKELETQLEEQALHDYLTGLPNRALFRDRVGHALERAGWTGERLAVFFIDLNRFKVINDSLGHEAGDRVLQEVARRLEVAVREQDTVARVGGDEFTVLLEDVEGETDELHVVERVVGSLSEPVELDERSVPVEASIGVAVHRGGDGEPPDSSELVRRANGAMYRAKGQPRTGYAVAGPSGEGRSPGRLEREARLREALDEERIGTAYQPIFSLASGRVCGVESLARWRDPELGEVEPAEFIPLAEETGLIVPLGEQQLEEACRQLLAEGFVDPSMDRPLRLHANLSARQLEDPEVVERTRRILERTGFPAGRLCLEITESAAMHEPEAVDRLKGLGVELAVDDFGTRYSTLAQLRELELDALKIDRTFVDGLPDDEKDRAIVETVLTLGRSLGMEVIAEGIETAEQLELLEELGCDQAQGFHLAVPLEPGELESLLQDE